MASKRVSTSKKKKKSSPKHSSSPVLNGIIAGLAVVILVFIYSMIQQQKPAPHETDLAYTELDEIPSALLSYQEEMQKEMDVVVEVLNGCGVSGLASKTKQKLIRKGVDVISTGNAPNHNYRKTIIYIHGDNFDKAKKISRLIGIETDPILEGISADVPCDLTIIVGHDYKKLKLSL